MVVMSRVNAKDLFPDDACILEQETGASRGGHKASGLGEVG